MRWEWIFDPLPAKIFQKKGLTSDVLDAMEDAFVLEEVDHEAKTAYFFYDVFADEDEWGEDL